MAKQIFRQEAVERMSSPEQLDELMPVTSTRGWIALAALSVLLLLGIAWGYFGKIDTTIEGGGVLVRPGAVFLFDAPAAGTVKEIHVQSNAMVKKGDKLITLTVIGPDGKPRDEIIRSLDDGRVLDVNVIRFDPVKKGGSLLAMDVPEKPLEAVIYVSAKDGYKIPKRKNGEPVKVQIFPVTGGSFLGTVKSAGRFPVTRTVMQHTLQNPDWSNEVLQHGPMLEVIVELPNNQQVQEVFSGTPCMGVITISSRRPVSFVLPIFDDSRN